MYDIDFKIMVYLFILCMNAHFPNSYCNIDPQHLNFVDDISFESYPWGIDVHDQIFVELARCKEKLIEIRTSIAKDKRGLSTSPCVLTGEGGGGALIFY